MGHITTDMEPLLFEMMINHDLQLHEVFSLIKAWTEVHYPAAIEEYLDGTNPQLKGIKYGSFK